MKDRARWSRLIALVQLCCVASLLPTQASEEGLDCITSVGEKRCQTLLGLQDSYAFQDTEVEWIAKDLNPWMESGITLDMVERAYCTNFEKSFRFQVVNGEMYIAGEFPGFMEFNRMVKMWILDVSRHHKLPDVDIVISTSDGCPVNKGFNGNETKCPTLGPVFSYDKFRNESHCVTYPDHTNYAWPMAGLPSWEDVRDMMSMGRQIPWEEKAPTMFFRGAQTGNRMTLNEDGTFIWHPLTDFRITGWTGYTEVGQYVTLPDHCTHKYLLNLPGMAYSARLKYLMFCNSSVIFANNHQEEFWYNLLEDGVNVVMVPAVTAEIKGADLIRALEELDKDQERAKRIAYAGYETVRTMLAPETVRRYFWELMEHYAKLQKFKPTVHPDAVPFKISALGPDAQHNIGTRTCEFCANHPDPPAKGGAAGAAQGTAHLIEDARQEKDAGQSR